MFLSSLVSHHPALRPIPLTCMPRRLYIPLFDDFEQCRSFPSASAKTSLLPDSTVPADADDLQAFGLIVRRINDEPFDVASVPGSRAVTIKFIIPNSRMGSVYVFPFLSPRHHADCHFLCSIGKGGSKIKEIQEASGARLNASEAMLPGSTEVSNTAPFSLTNSARSFCLRCRRRHPHRCLLYRHHPPRIPRTQSWFHFRILPSSRCSGRCCPRSWPRSQLFSRSRQCRAWSADSTNLHSQLPCRRKLVELCIFPFSPPNLLVPLPPTPLPPLPSAPLPPFPPFPASSLPPCPTSPLSPLPHHTFFSLVLALPSMLMVSTPD